MVNETAVISKEEALEELNNYIVRARELKELLGQVEKGSGNDSWQVWTEVKEKYAFIENGIQKHYDYLNSGETFGLQAAFFETAIKDIHVSMSALNMDMNAQDFLDKLSLILIEVEGYSKFWSCYSHRN